MAQFVFAIVVVWSLPAIAERKSIVVTSTGLCPSADAVAKTVAELLPSVEVTTDENGGGAIRVRIDDRGDRYSVSLAEAQREIVDPIRACEERARTAAVLIVMAVEPWEVGVDRFAAAPPPLRVALAPTLAEAIDRRATRFLLAVEASGRFDGGFLGSSDSTPAFGARIHFDAGRTWLGTAIGVSALAPTTIQLSSGSAHLLRIPIDLDLRFALRRSGAELAGEIGVALIVVDAQGQGFVTNEHALGVEIGIRTGISFRWWLWDRIAPVVGVGLLLVPSPVDLVVTHAGTVATTPRVWLDASIGVAARIK